MFRHGSKVKIYVAALLDISPSELSRTLPGLRHSSIETRRFYRNTTENFTNILDAKSKTEIYAARLIAALFLAGGAVTVAPYAATALVENNIKLLKTQSDFLRDAGIDRLYYLLSVDKAKQKALEAGAVGALLGTLDTLDNQKKLYRVLSSLDALSSQKSLFLEEMERNNCARPLKKLLYFLEEVQLDVPIDSPTSEEFIPKNFQLARSLYKDCLWACNSRNRC